MMTESEWVEVEVTIPAHQSILGDVPERTITVPHTRACVERRAQYERELAAFAGRYPGYCRVCGGTGSLTYTENQAPLGSGLYWPMQMAEPCRACEGHCPRCGNEPQGWDDAAWEGFYEGERPCPRCGMVLGDVEMEVAPYKPECSCYEHYYEMRAKGEL